MPQGRKIPACVRSTSRCAALHSAASAEPLLIAKPSSIVADPTMAALKAIREIAEHVRPRRGCQEGICGKCESKVNGDDTRLCITPIGTLMGAVVVTPAPRKSIWG